jgi:hypothetical protein
LAADATPDDDAEVDAADPCALASVVGSGAVCFGWAGWVVVFLEHGPFTFGAPLLTHGFHSSR